MHQPQAYQKSGGSNNCASFYSTTLKWNIHFNLSKWLFNEFNTL